MHDIHPLVLLLDLPRDEVNFLEDLRFVQLLHQLGLKDPLDPL